MSSREEASSTGAELCRARVVVRGVVQGVGFRPFIYRLAGEYGLKGWVLNSTEGVVIEVEGTPEKVSDFTNDIPRKAPVQAVVETVESYFLPPLGYQSFDIQASQQEKDRFVLISPDIATCPHCLGELFRPGDRRYRYPFTNCTNCGPRFTIVKDVPYDRPKTTMTSFQMCPDCQGEYDSPFDRRFHAQPNACPVCGPQVWLVSREKPADVMAQGEEAVALTRQMLKKGAIVAIKGIGGFHLACDARNEEAIAALRERKHRVNKPFAVMSFDRRAVEHYCFLSEAERRLLVSPQRPIVLLRRKEDSPVSPLVAPANAYLGVMLPYSPLHYLLLERRGEGANFLALVMTSGNLSEEPIAIDNEEALARLSTLADAFLLHDRPIHVRCDDSVTRVFGGKEAVIRRSRGYAPFPVKLDFEMRQVLACGAELKNTFCLTKQNYAFLSHHIGDMENLETLTSFEEGIEHFKRVFRVSPEVIAYDLHPEYLATRYALQRQGDRTVRLVGVQHHHAHIASCLAENGENGPVIGVAFDGTGYGEDSQIWGGEFLVGDFRHFVRSAHLKYVVLPGGQAAIKKPYRMALSYLHDLPRSLVDGLDLLARIDQNELRIIGKQVETRLNSPLTSSCGRLFDAVSALLGVCDVATYEGEAAVMLEMLADEGEKGTYDWATRGSLPLVVDQTALFEGIINDMKRGVPREIISARFHNSLGRMIAGVCALLRRRYNLSKVALSGGVFQNLFLLRRTVDFLEQRNFAVLIHHQVPCNDGGIALGQAVIADARAGL